MKVIHQGIILHKRHLSDRVGWYMCGITMQSRQKLVDSNVLTQLREQRSHLQRSNIIHINWLRECEEAIGSKEASPPLATGDALTCWRRHAYRCPWHRTLRQYHRNDTYLKWKKVGIRFFTTRTPYANLAKDKKTTRRSNERHQQFWLPSVAEGRLVYSVLNLILCSYLN